MDQTQTLPVPTRREIQQVKVGLAIGRCTKLSADVTLTPAGIVAIGALVSSILLSTAVIVRSTRR